VLQLSAEELAKFRTYERCSTAVECFMLLEASALASNKLLGTIEASFSGHDLHTKDYLFLQLISEKRSRNFLKLTDVRQTQALFTEMRDRALAAAHVESET
jgi:hypothetical protein